MINFHSNNFIIFKFVNIDILFINIISKSETQASQFFGIIHPIVFRLGNNNVHIKIWEDILGKLPCSVMDLEKFFHNPAG